MPIGLDFGLPSTIEYKGLHTPLYMMLSATIKCQGEDDGDDDDGDGDDGDDDDGVDCIHHPLAFIGAFCGGRCHQNALGSSMVTKIKIEMSTRVAKM